MELRIGGEVPELRGGSCCNLGGGVMAAEAVLIALFSVAPDA